MAYVNELLMLFARSFAMSRRSRPEMIAETRAKLIAAARKAFGERGYAEASMDDFTAEAGLTRGALYHHFGDKKGLFEAVVHEMDAEMAARLKTISDAAPTRWDGFVEENVGYVKMALEPEVQRIVLLDGPAVLGDPSVWPRADGCIASLRPHGDAAGVGGRLHRLAPRQPGAIAGRRGGPGGHRRRRGRAAGLRRLDRRSHVDRQRP